MAPRKCEHQDCQWSYEDRDINVYLQMLGRHCDAVHPKPVGEGAERPLMKAERAKRPELAAEVSDEDWNYFLDRWERYKVSTKIAGEEVITQLLECCCDQLRRDHHRTFLSSQTQQDLDVLRPN